MSLIPRFFQCHNEFSKVNIFNTDLAKQSYYNYTYFPVCAASVVLNSSMGMRGACPGETVTYTCAVNQGFVLEWIVEPFLPTSARIQFTTTTDIGSRLDCNSVAAVQCEDFNFVATLTATANPTVVMTTTLADMTSTLTFTATARLNGTVVQCRGTTADGLLIANRMLNVAGAFILQYVAYT